MGLEEALPKLLNTGVGCFGVRQRLLRCRSRFLQPCQRSHILHVRFITTAAPGYSWLPPVSGITDVK